MANNVSMKDFLQLFYMQDLIINMPEAQFAQYQAYLKANDGKGDFRGNMKMWRDKGLVNRIEKKDKNGKVIDVFWERNMQYVGDQGTRGSSAHAAIAPSPTQMEDKDWEKLFRELQNAFRDMAANRDDFKDNKKATEFLDEYFGDNKLFSMYKATPQTKSHIDKLQDLLKTHANTMHPLLSNIFETRQDYDKFVKDIKDEKYNSNPKTRDKLLRIINAISHEMNWGDGFTKHPQIAATLAGVGIDAIISGLNDKNEVINPNKLDYFKRNYQNILLGATQDKVYDVVKNYSSSIAGAVEYAKEKVDYNNPNSKDYIPPKRNDQLTDWQKISDWVGKRWSDHMDKYTKLRGGHVYFSPQAKSIVNALDGAKFKPNDGLGKLLENADKIKKNLQYKSPSATAHFEWMTKKLGELKSKKMFEGALKNASQMKALVSELAIMALEDGKSDSMDAVKTAMEVLTVIKYGYTTSNVMDAMKKEDVSIFSDKSLSWNKHEGMRFVTTAMDKSIKFAFLGAGYLLNGAGHFIKTRNKKFNAKSGKPNKYQKDLKSRTDAEKAELERQQRTDSNQKRRINTKLNQYRRTGVTEATLDADITRYNTDLQDLYNRQRIPMSYINHWLNDPANQSDPDFANVQRFYEEIDNQQSPTPITITGTDPYLQSSIDDIQNDLSTIADTQNKLQGATDKRQEFQNGTDTVKMINAQMRDRKQKIDNWDKDHQDKFTQLMAHWDFLQSGSSRTGENILQQMWNGLMPISQEGKQKKYDTQKDRTNPFTNATEKMSQKDWLRMQWLKKHGYSNAA
ncbi:MAG: hypothetical protein NC311_01130 [Muribaculaceae bacterium]|nr:hypothetical protein [Muribaculaceae bacterium]